MPTVSGPRSTATTQPTAQPTEARQPNAAETPAPARAGWSAPVGTVSRETGTSFEPALPARVTGVTYQPVPGALYVDGVGANDVVQGNLGDCFLISTLAAFAQQKPQLLQKAITDNADGSFTVHLYKRQVEPPGVHKQPRTILVPVDIRVDGALPAYPGGLPAFSRGQVPSELWGPIIEKAYAQMKGGYSKLDKGGLPSSVMEALTGEPASLRLAFLLPASRNLHRVAEALEAGTPVTAATWSQAFRKLTVPGLVPGHAYTVLATGEENGQRWVELRNPWGFTEPQRDGRDDGVFRLTEAEFSANFPTLFIAD